MERRYNLGTEVAILGPDVSLGTLITLQWLFKFIRIGFPVWWSVGLNLLAALPGDRYE